MFNGEMDASLMRAQRYHPAAPSSNNGNREHKLQQTIARPSSSYRPRPSSAARRMDADERHRKRSKHWPRGNHASANALLTAVVCWCSLILCLHLTIEPAASSPAPIASNAEVRSTPSASPNSSWRRVQHRQNSGQDERQRLHPSNEFTHYATVVPQLQHGRSKRSLTSTHEGNGLHASHLTLTYRLNEADVIVDLQLNEQLIPADHFLSYQLPNRTGKHVLRYNRPEEVDLCHYRGKIRGRPDTTRVAISTCDGSIRGVIMDHDETYYIESLPRSSLATVEDDKNDDAAARIDLGEHFIYRHADLVASSANNTGTSDHSKCGYNGGHANATHDPGLYRELGLDRVAATVERTKRATSSSSSTPIRGPYNANKHSSYVELVIVVDNKMFKAMRENYKTVQRYCKDITNIINALYEPLNIFIGLVGVVVWNENDEIEMSKDGELTLKNFLHYRKKTLIKDHPNDNAQLFTKEHFDGGVVGKALKGPICTYEFSGGVEMYHSEIIGVQATTVAHEMGHNFGMEHDTADCQCPEERCIMSASSSSIAPKHWSRCSIDQLNLAFNHGMNYCLKNKPETLFDSPVCGNGFVENGEQCDCGLKEYCENSCCDPVTCMLYSNASCATGECCDLSTCMPKIGGTVCRAADGECDLPEYCSGESEYCPRDVFKRDTEECDGGKAYCYRGSCRSQNDQCRLLWGPTGKSSDQCYAKNEEGSRHGNCGYNRVKNEYVKCDEADVQCGMLHCRHLNERLEFGMESVAILSHSFMTYNGSVIPCRTAIVDLGLQKVDPGLTPDGAKCGEGKMCLNQMCTSVEKLIAGGNGKLCPENCNGKGICNSEGHCHCEEGFGPPLCNVPGPGGSVDSGPSTDPNAGSTVRRLMYIFFCGVVPLSAIFAIVVYYFREGNIFTRKRKSPTSVLNIHIKPDSSHSASSTHTMLPSSPNSPDSDMNSALLRPSATNQVATAGSGVGGESDFVANNNMFGKFKGFTLQPLPQSNAPNSGNKKSPKVAFVAPVAKCSEDTTSNTVPARAAPPVPKPLKSLATAGSPVPGSLERIHDNVTYHNKPTALPPMNPGSTARPIISSPILESSTCTSRELASSNRPPGAPVAVPIRPAPTLPSVVGSSEPTVSFAPSGAASLATNPADTGSLPAEVLINPVSRDKKLKESKLNRITSYLKKEEKPTKPEPKQLRVIDRDRLRTIAISAPIPIEQSAAELAKSMPKLNDEPVIGKDGEGSAGGSVQRAKSMRDPESIGAGVQRKVRIFDERTMIEPAPSSATKKPTVALKRPQSMVGTRPTIPPPRPPVPAAIQTTHAGLKIPGMPGYQNPPPPKSVKIMEPPTRGAKTIERTEYDDCRNGGGETHGTNGMDNIYAVIDESPSPPSILSPPMSAISSGGSSESMGLLGEIVNEIESRHGDSVYIASTLRRSGDGSSSRKSSSIASSQPTVVANGSLVGDEEHDDDEPTYVNTSEIIDDDDDDFDATEDDDESAEEEETKQTVAIGANRTSSLSTTSSGYLRPSAISSAPIARIAPSTAGGGSGGDAVTDSPSTANAANSLSSFKALPSPSGPAQSITSAANVLNQIKFQGPTTKEPPKKVPASSNTSAGGASSAYKPYHSVLSNSARSGSVVAATKAKIASEKSNAPTSTTSASVSTTTGKANSATKPQQSVRTRTPSPRGSMSNGQLPNGTVQTGAKSAAIGQKPKTSTKPEPLTSKPTTTPVGTKIANPSTTIGNGKLLTAAARPAPGKPSNVASLQQRFEQRK
ncbi:uncharacterized protein LOC125951089 isoform X2 [Anopheles darlingi]|uniref:uncharacterized protein LOC125951089 isoform X2 n=1 Tax=Anopheles darlingi TaxID=43151 RepID=UPI00210038EA|nr:uncharacterized protein LOC125951089 isoform X2 [Anopheles darlingi]